MTNRGQKLIIFAWWAIFLCFEGRNHSLLTRNHRSFLLFIFTWFFQLLGRELFLYYGPQEGCNECLECRFEAGSTSLICTDTCRGFEFKGCSTASSDAACNEHFCTWTPSGPNSTAGTCAFDKQKGGMCQRHTPSAHFISNSADFDTNYGGMITLGEILIGGSWCDFTKLPVHVHCCS